MGKLVFLERLRGHLMLIVGQRLSERFRQWPAAANQGGERTCDGGAETLQRVGRRRENRLMIFGRIGCLTGL